MGKKRAVWNGRGLVAGFTETWSSRREGPLCSFFCNMYVLYIYVPDDLFLLFILQLGREIVA